MEILENPKPIKKDVRVVSNEPFDPKQAPTHAINASLLENQRKSEEAMDSNDKPQTNS